MQNLKNKFFIFTFYNIINKNMINFIYVFFLSYLFTLFGFLLGNSTKEEHKEIKSKVLLFAEVLFIFYYLIIVNIFSENTILILILGVLFILHLIAKYMLKMPDLQEFYYLLILAISLIGFYKYSSLNMYYILILIVVIMLENSMKTFILRKEIYSLITYAIVYFIYSILTISNIL